MTGNLNESLRQAAAEASRRWPGVVPVAVCADLPALLPADLDAALGDAAERGSTSAFVADHDGVGTTLYTATYDAFDPHFGHRSRQAHLDGGAREITLPVGVACASTSTTGRPSRTRSTSGSVRTPGWPCCASTRT